MCKFVDMVPIAIYKSGASYSGVGPASGLELIRRKGVKSTGGQESAQGISTTRKIPVDDRDPA